MSILRATFIFWFTFAAGGAMALGFDVVFLGGAGGPEWGGVSGSLFWGVVVSAIAAVPAAVFHAAAVLLLRLMPAIVPSFRDASSALSAVAALVGGGLWLMVLDQDGSIPDWAPLIVIGPIPFVLSLLVVPLVARLKRPEARATRGPVP